MIISVINHTGHLSDEEVQAAVRAVNRQSATTSSPIESSVRGSDALEGRSPGAPKTMDLPGHARRRGALPSGTRPTSGTRSGYHERNNEGISYGFVFTKIARDLGES